MKLKTVIDYISASPAENFDPGLLDLDVTRFPTDSREIKRGEVFFAFSQPEFEDNGFNGEFIDATAFVVNAFKKGAAVCVVRKDRFDEHDLREFSDRLLFSDDVIASFQKLAMNVARDWARPVVAITGSAGKTTAKELTAHVLESTGKRVLKNDKNLNNGLGHPITVLKLAENSDFDIAVLEMGMSTPKQEIARLCRITPPDIGVELNVLPVHVEHLGSIEKVAEAKAELVQGLKTGGTAILNNDDERVSSMRALHDGPVITFGIDKESDLMAKEITMKQFGDTHFILKTPDGDTDVVFQLSGKHNILNALAASAVGYNFGMTGAEIASSLESVLPPKQRGEVIRFAAGFTVINDSYNSNPDALLKMVKTLKEGAGPKSRTIVIAGEMLELGGDEKKIHLETGREIAVAGVDILYGVRGLADELVRGAKEGGIAEAAYFEDATTAGEHLSEVVRAGDIILVKGSRGVKTERSIEVLTGRFELETGR